MSKIIGILVSSFLLILIIYLLFSIKNIENSIFINATDETKIIAFTFDDGPSEYTLEIANELASYGFKATFFQIGNKMYENQSILKELIKLDMEIGSHTYSHKLLTEISMSEVQNEFNSTKILFNEITNENIKLTRFPYGEVHKNILSYALTPVIGWSIDTKDWYYKNSEHILNEILKSKNGDIILMHDTYKETLEAVKKVLPILKEKGYIVTSVSELAQLNNKTLNNGVIYNYIYN